MKNLFLFAVFIFNVSNAQISDFKTINFERADNIANLNKGVGLKNLPLLAQKLTSKLPTKVEKFRAIYTWVCKNIKGDIKQSNKIDKERKKHQNDSVAYLKWNNAYKKIAYKKLLKHKKTMCTGYAYLIKELCFLANIECEIVDGYGRTVDANVKGLEKANHSWNAIKLNNKWYLCDATWSSGYAVSNGVFVKDYNLGYFLTDPVLFSKNHYPLNKMWLLNSALMTSKFVVTPLVYGETFEHKVIPMFPEEMDVTVKKNSEINFIFKSLKDISTNDVSLIKFSRDTEKSLKIYNLKNNDGLIEFKSLFKYKGFYDVHLKINNDIVATYTINVTKN